MSTRQKRNGKKDHLGLFDGRFLSFVFFVLCLSLAASAGPTFTFERITSNTPHGDLMPTLEMTLDSYLLSDSSEGVLFTFGLTGPGCISEIYFENSTLLSLAEILDNPPSVSFVTGAKPPVLPGGNNLEVPFVVAQSLSVQASGNNHTGIQDGQTLGVAYRLLDGAAFDDVLNALDLGYTDPAQSDTLRIALHVRSLGLDGEESDSFLAIPPVPTPGAIMLGSVGLMVVGWLRRRKSL